jgi:hypothetical protein
VRVYWFFLVFFLTSTAELLAVGYPSCADYLSKSPPKKIFDIRGARLHADFNLYPTLAWSTSLSPGAKRIAYVTVNGVEVFDIENGYRVEFLSNSPDRTVSMADFLSDELLVYGGADWKKVFSFREEKDVASTFLDSAISDSSGGTFLEYSIQTGLFFFKSETSIVGLNASGKIEVSFDFGGITRSIDEFHFLEQQKRILISVAPSNGVLERILSRKIPWPQFFSIPVRGNPGLIELQPEYRLEDDLPSEAAFLPRSESGEKSGVSYEVFCGVANAFSQPHVLKTHVNVALNRFLFPTGMGSGVSKRHHVSVRTADATKVLGTLRFGGGSIKTMCFSPSGRFLAFGLYGGLRLSALIEGDAVARHFRPSVVVYQTEDLTEPMVAFEGDGPTVSLRWPNDGEIRFSDTAGNVYESAVSTAP